MDTKHCPKCGQDKPLDKEHWQKKLAGWQSHCKACRNAKAKSGKATKAKPAAKPKAVAKSNGHVSLLDAAAQVLAASSQPMQVRPLAQIVIAKGLWAGDSQKPSQTLSAQIQREIKTKGKDSRFARAGRGLFAAKAD